MYPEEKISNYSKASVFFLRIKIIRENLNESYKEAGQKKKKFLKDDREKNAAALFDIIDSFACDDAVCTGNFV